MRIIIGIIVGLAIAWYLAGIGSKTRMWEQPRNENHPAPEDQQLKWHIAHIRDDVSTMTMCSLVIVAIEVYRLFN